MRKKALEVRKSDKISLGGEILIVEETEISDIGKQGSRKVRIVAKKSTGEKIIIIRPADYPVDVK